MLVRSLCAPQVYTLHFFSYAVLPYWFCLFVLVRSVAPLSFARGSLLLCRTDRVMGLGGGRGWGGKANSSCSLCLLTENLKVSLLLLLLLSLSRVLSFLSLSLSITRFVCWGIFLCSCSKQMLGVHARVCVRPRVAPQETIAVVHERNVQSKKPHAHAQAHTKQEAQILQHKENESQRHNLLGAGGGGGRWLRPDRERERERKRAVVAKEKGETLLRGGDGVALKS